MATRSHPKFSFFDYAKNYIELFIKGRTRTDGRMMPLGRENDRYFLATTQGVFPENFKLMMEKVPQLVLDELKYLPYPYGCHSLHTTILDAFRALLMNRAQTGIDGYGSGRAPMHTEQVMVIALTDGSGVAAIPSDFRLFFDPPILGSEYTKEAYRWDQKLYTIVFRIPSTPYRPTNSQLVQIDIDHPNIERLCALTGGRSYSIVSVRQIQTSIDQILLIACQHRIGVRFDCVPPIHFTAGRIPAEESNKMRIKIKRVVEKRPVTNLISRVNPQGRPVNCHWPIPENFFPMRNQDNLPPRTAHPVILMAPEALPIPIRNELPVDKLELEPGPIGELVMEMLQGRKDWTVWTYMEGASHGPTSPFGCLRLNASGLGVSLLLLPYNFPLLYPLIEDLVREPILTTSQVWRAKIEQYIQTVPYYYFSSLRHAMDKLKVKLDISSSMSSTYAPQLLSHLNRLKIKAKEDWDSSALVAKLTESRCPRDPNRSGELPPVSIRIERITSRTCMVGLKGDDDRDERDKHLEKMDYPPIYSGDYSIPLYPPKVNDAERDSAYKTPHCGSVEDMVGKLNRIQANLELMFDPGRVTLLDMAKLGTRVQFSTLEELHNMTMKSMGEYEGYQAARVRHYGQPFKKIEEEKERSHAFGNPYKLKGLGAGIDEVMDSAIVEGNSKNEAKRFGDSSRNQWGGPPKRRRGPLGIDAFDKWRTRRSTCGSSAPSDISEDISSVLSDLAENEPSTSTSTRTPTPAAASTPIREFEGMKVESTERVRAKEPPVKPVKEKSVEVIRQKTAESYVQKGRTEKSEKLSSQEMMTRKIRIGTIVRKPANHRAYEEIQSVVAGTSEECSQILIRHAIRETMRFKLKELTKKLEKHLSQI
ncbi:unnamed protein product [Caenorhabditis sp. 36 PRJEB53466]|nr:unnamed protein product [Caenorhabditis sp. 36 PRJEB53466]